MPLAPVLEPELVLVLVTVPVLELLPVPASPSPSARLLLPPHAARAADSVIIIATRISREIRAHQAIFESPKESV